jgi:hypothetical protein
MIDEADILSSLKTRIEKFLPNIAIKNQDCKSFQRPVFWLNTVSTVDTQSSTSYELNSFSFEIVYFSSTYNKGYLELLDTKTILKAILTKPLKIIETWTDSESKSCERISFVDIETSSISLNTEDYTLTYVINIKVEQEIDYSELGIDLDSDNMTDDELFNSETITETEAELTVESVEIETFSES